MDVTATEALLNEKKTLLKLVAFCPFGTKC